MQQCSEGSEKIKMIFRFCSEDWCTTSLLIRENLDVFFGFQMVWKTSSDLQRNQGNATNGLPNKIA